MAACLLASILISKEAKTSDTPTTPKPEVASTETIKGKNGAVVTRTTMKDGTVNVKRVNSKGNVSIELNDVYDMAAAVRDATQNSGTGAP